MKEILRTEAQIIKKKKKERKKEEEPNGKF